MTHACWLLTYGFFRTRVQHVLLYGLQNAQVHTFGFTSFKKSDIYFGSVASSRNMNKNQLINDTNKHQAWTIVQSIAKALFHHQEHQKKKKAISSLPGSLGNKSTLSPSLPFTYVLAACPSALARTHISYFSGSNAYRCAFQPAFCDRLTNDTSPILISWKATAPRSDKRIRPALHWTVELIREDKERRPWGLKDCLSCLWVWCSILFLDFLPHWCIVPYSDDAFHKSEPYLTSIFLCQLNFPKYSCPIFKWWADVQGLVFQTGQGLIGTKEYMY